MKIQQAGWRLMVLAGAFSSLVGCAHAVNVQRLSQVKSAAIIAYNGEVDIREEKEGGSLGAMLSGAQGLTDVASAEVTARRVDEAQKTYDALVAKLNTGLGWNVLPREKVVNDPEVKKLFADKMANVSVNKGFRFGIDGIVWSEYGDLPKSEQQALKNSLGVDTLIVVRVQVKQGRIYGVGAGQNGVYEVYPKAILSFAAYDPDEGSAVWNERWVEGPNTPDHLMRIVGVNETKDEAKLVVEATDLATDVLVAKYAQLSGKAPAAAVATSPAP
jgi:hypothetical protein